MPLALVTTPGDPTANAYATIAQVSAVDDEQIPVTTWASQNPNTQTRAIVRATQIVDQARFRGDRATTTQALEWPRVGVAAPSGLAYDPTVIPDVIVRATARLAIWLAVQAVDPEEMGDTANLSSMTIGGGLSFSFRDGTRLTSLQAFLVSVIRPILGPVSWANQPRVARG